QRQTASRPSVVVRTPTIASLTAVSAIDTGNINQAEQATVEQRNQSSNLPQIREQNRRKLVRYVYFGQAVLIIVVALAWIAFVFLDLRPNNSTTNKPLYNNVTFVSAKTMENLQNDTAKTIPTVSPNSSSLFATLATTHSTDYLL
ncbi:unnamed protein product, partial [Gongylonema pulchrum]|uniref:Serine/threonine protein kinase n=1 Tax=Gongylonema pulchrum TaxID=637853 RepID=A0A183EW32_9BILA